MFDVSIASDRFNAWNHTYRKFTTTLGAHPPTDAFLDHPLIDVLADEILTRRAIEPSRDNYISATWQSAYILSQVAMDPSGLITAECATADDWRADAKDLASRIKKKDRRIHRRAWLVRQMLLIADLLDFFRAKPFFLPTAGNYHNDIVWSNF